jgi:hypothetical protein
MATAHLKQFLEVFELYLDGNKKSTKPIQVLIDNRRAVAMVQGTSEN